MGNGSASPGSGSTSRSAPPAPGSHTPNSPGIGPRLIRPSAVRGAGRAGGLPRWPRCPPCGNMETDAINISAGAKTNTRLIYPPARWRLLVYSFAPVCGYNPAHTGAGYEIESFDSAIGDRRHRSFVPNFLRIPAADRTAARRRRKPYQDSMEPPIVFWVPAITPSGLTFYTGNKFPNWKNNVFVGGLQQGEVPRSGHVDRLDFNEKWEELHRESFVRSLPQRVRDVRESPDGYLYLLTAENQGALIRIEPFTASGK